MLLDDLRREIRTRHYSIRLCSVQTKRGQVTMLISEQSRVPCYANGEPYRALHTPHSEKFRPRHCLANALPSLLYPDLTWARLWDLVSSELDHQNYSAATKALYRSILRNVYRHAHGRPAGVNAGTQPPRRHQSVPSPLTSPPHPNFDIRNAMPCHGEDGFICSTFPFSLPRPFQDTPINRTP